jgi:hypothetical protein
MMFIVQNNALNTHIKPVIQNLRHLRVWHRMCVMIKKYNVCKMMKESHPISRNTNHSLLHGLRQILYLNHQNPMSQTRHVSLHVLKDSLCFSPRHLISPVPSTMSRNPVHPSWTYICITQVSS